MLNQVSELQILVARLFEALDFWKGRSVTMKQNDREIRELSVSMVRKRKKYRKKERKKERRKERRKERKGE